MATGTCQLCGDKYEFGHDGNDPFTTITVSFHDDDRADFAESVCQSCGDELLGDVYTALSEAPAISGGGGSVEVDTETARVAYRELVRTIERTGGPNVGADEACTPLVAVREKIAGNDDLDDYARGFALGAIDQVADERNVDVSGADPLTDATFQAKHDLADVLEVED